MLLIIFTQIAFTMLCFSHAAVTVYLVHRKLAHRGAGVLAAALAVTTGTVSLFSTIAQLLL